MSKFNSNSSDNDLSTGQTDAFLKSLRVDNLVANFPLKTNSSKTLVSEKLQLSDIDGVIISNPYTGTVEATDFKTDTYDSVNTQISSLTQKTQYQTAVAGTGTTNFSDSGITLSSIYNPTKITSINLSQNSISVDAPTFGTQDIRPSQDGAYDIGSGALRYDTVYCGTLDAPRIINVLDPVSAQDAATKFYADNFAWLSPIMTSATTPAPYVITTNSINGSHPNYWQLFDYISASNWWHTEALFTDQGGSFLWDGALGKQGIPITGAWCVMDMGENKTIKGCRYRPFRGAPTDGHAKSFYFIYSQDGINYNVAATLVDQVFEADTYVEYTFTPISARYWGIQIYEAHNSFVVSQDMNFIGGTERISYIDSKLPIAGGTMTGAIDMGTNLISNVADPGSAQDVATKAYVDSAKDFIDLTPTTEPSAVEGRVYYDSATNVLKFHNGTVWSNI